MVIMFYGGFGTNVEHGKAGCKESIILSSLGVVATALITGLFCIMCWGLIFWKVYLWAPSSAPDPFAVSNILRSKTLTSNTTAPLLELESSSNDPTAYTMTMVFLSLIIGSKVSAPIIVLTQVALGIGMGFAFAWVVGKLLKHLPIEADGLYAVFMVSAMLIVYSVTDFLGGNGYLALYILGIYLGNMEFRGKRDIVFSLMVLPKLYRLDYFSSWACCLIFQNSFLPCQLHLLSPCLWQLLHDRYLFMLLCCRFTLSLTSLTSFHLREFAVLPPSPLQFWQQAKAPNFP